MSGAESSELDPFARSAMRAEFREARERAQKDAEAFEGIIHAVERLGILLTGEVQNLCAYGPEITKLATPSALATEIPALHRSLHIPFPDLYTLVRRARNDAVHQGSYARHLTEHAVQLALVLEDAIMIKLDQSTPAPLVADFMVRNVVCAEGWQPISFVRQQLLTNSFSYLPMYVKGEWFLLSDVAVAKFLRSGSKSTHASGPGQSGEGSKAPAIGRNKRMAMTVQDALAVADRIELIPARDRLIGADESIPEVVDRLGESPLLVVDNQRSGTLRGILMAFDLL